MNTPLKQCKHGARGVIQGTVFGPIHCIMYIISHTIMDDLNNVVVHQIKEKRDILSK